MSILKSLIYQPRINPMSVRGKEICLDELDESIIALVEKRGTVPLKELKNYFPEYSDFKLNYRSHNLAEAGYFNLRKQRHVIMLYSNNQERSL